MARPRPARRSRPTRGLAAVLITGVVAATCTALAPPTAVVRAAAESASRTVHTAPAAPAPALGWTATPAPFRLTFLTAGRPVLAQAAGTAAGPGGRMAYALADGSTHRLTDLATQRRTRTGVVYTVGTDEPGRTATVAVDRTPRGLRVDWTFTPAAGVAQVYEALTGDDTEHFLGGGANFIFTDLRHRVLLNKASFTGAGTLHRCNKGGAPSPFFVSSRGYGLFPDTPSIGRIAFPNAVDDPPHCLPATSPPPCPVQLGQPDRTQLCFKSGRLAYELYAGSPAQVVRAYTARAGYPKMPPVRQFALTHWRDTVPNQATVIDDVDQLRARGIPQATEWIDNPWEISTNPPGAPRTGGGACNGTLSFDPEQFPDPAKMVADLRARGVHLGIWISPFVRPRANNLPCPDVGYPPGSFVETGRTDRYDIDFTSPAGRAHFEAKLAALFGLGIDMVKGDRGEETDFETARFAAGPGSDLNNPYPVLYAKSTVAVLQRLYGSQYTTLFRAGYTGQPSVLNGFWGADPTATFEGLRLSVRRGLNSWLSGHPAWGTDTGGYSGGGPGAPTSSLFTRWSQFSAVSPIFEVGGAGRNATPWLYDDATVKRFRDSVLLHYALFPYLYGLAQRSARTGEPITRPLAFDHPADENAWAADQHMMIGSDLLAVPVSADRAEADGAAGQPTPVEVYLPRGSWIDLYTGQRHEGGQRIVRNSTLDDFPLYLRAGAAIGFNSRIDGVWAQPWGLNDLDRRDRAGWLYAPAAGRTAAISPYGGRLLADSTGGRTEIRLTGAPAQTQVLVTTAASPARVLVDGRPVRGVASAAQLRDLPSGWTRQPGPFGGLLIKLSPQHGRSSVVITVR